MQLHPQPCRCHGAACSLPPCISTYTTYSEMFPSCPAAQLSRWSVWVCVSASSTSHYLWEEMKWSSFLPCKNRLLQGVCFGGDVLAGDVWTFKYHIHLLTKSNRSTKSLSMTYKESKRLSRWKVFVGEKAREITEYSLLFNSSDGSAEVEEEVWFSPQTHHVFTLQSIHLKYLEIDMQSAGNRGGEFDDLNNDALKYPKTALLRVLNY